MGGSSRSRKWASKVCCECGSGDEFWVGSDGDAGGASSLVIFSSNRGKSIGLVS